MARVTLPRKWRLEPRTFLNVNGKPLFPPFLEQWKAFLKLLSIHHFQGSDVDTIVLPLVPMFHTGAYNLPFRILKEKEVIQLSGLQDFWNNVNLSDVNDEKKYRGAGLQEVQTWWKTCKDWMARYKTHSEPFIYDIKKLLKALSDKEAVAQSEVDAFMENCAKRWQTREGTYQLKRRRLPDVRDSPEYPGADIDMEDI